MRSISRVGSLMRRAVGISVFWGMLTSIIAAGVLGPLMSIITAHSDSSSSVPVAACSCACVTLGLIAPQSSEQVIAAGGGVPPLEYTPLVTSSRFRDAASDCRFPDSRSKAKEGKTKTLKLYCDTQSEATTLTGAMLRARIRSQPG